MKRILLAMVLVLMMVFPVMAQPVPIIRADSVQYSTPYLTYAPYIAGGTNYTGEIKLTISQPVGELKTWGYAIMPNTWNNIGQNYNGQLFELGGEANLAQWIHYFYSNRDMTILANARELQAKILGWAYYDGNNVLQGPNTYQPLGFPPVLYEGNINDLYGHANAWGGTIFIYAKGAWTYPPRFVQPGNHRFERRENPTTAPVMRLAFQAVNGDGSQITLDQIESVEWIGKGLGTPYMLDTVFSMGVSYNTTKRFWNPPQIGQPFTELQYHWSNMPTELGPATFRITLKDGNVLPDLNTYVKSLNDLPVIPAIFTRETYDIIKQKDKKSGKIVVKAELIEETVNNITVREIPDPIGCNPAVESCGTALVIQWPEPDIALLGGLDMPTDMCGTNNPCAQYQVKVMVGGVAVVTPAPNGVTKECHLWYDVPAQMGTVVVDTDSYTLLKNELASRGFDPASLRAMIAYREYYLMPPGSPPIMIPYINRASSSLVSINTFE